MSETRVTARTYRSKSGEIVTEYLIDGMAYSDPRHVEALLEDR